MKSTLSMLFRRGGAAASLLLLALTFLGCGNSESFVFTNTPAPTPSGPTPAGLVFQTTPQRTAGTTFNTIRVAVVDQSGAVVPGAGNEITIALANPNGATLSGTLTKSAVDGVAVFDDLSVDLAGNYSFIATSPGLDPTQSVAFVVTPDMAAKIAFVQQPTDTKVGAPFAPQVSVEVLDDLGNRVSEDFQVTLSIENNPSGTAVLIGTTTVDTVDGLATFPGDLAVTVGVGAGFTLKAQAGTFTATSEAFDVEKIPVALLHAESVTPSDLQSSLLATGVFSEVKVLSVRDDNPTQPILADLQAYDAALVWSNGQFKSAGDLGDLLAEYFDAGGRVVVGGYATSNIPIQGNFGTKYLLVEPTGNAPDDSNFGIIHEPTSPLLLGVDTSATTGDIPVSSGGAMNDGIVVAEWGNDNRPMIVRGTFNGRNRVDLNGFVPWLPAELLRNALLFQ